MSLSFRSPLRSLFVTTALVCATGHLRAEGFGSAVSQARKDHYKFVPIEAHKLIMEDKPDEAMQCFVRAVPDDKLTAADCFVLGEVFFRYDSEKALKYYRRANALLPDEPETNLELARSLHRTGDHAEAGIRYEQFLAKNPDRDLPRALLAECLVRAGKLKEALAHWEKARPEENSTGIGRSIFEVHGPISPLKRRADLLKAVRQGQTAQMEDLIALSAVWEVDWWQTEVNKAFLQRDMEMAKQVLVKEPQRLVELTLYARTFLEEVNAEWLKKELEEGLWLIGDDGRLPGSARVAERLMNLAVKHRLADVPTLLARFEKELRARSLGPGSNDLGAAHLLAGMLTLAGKARSADLPAVTLAGWQKYYDPMLAGNYLATQMNQNKLKHQSPELIQAMTEFPQDPMLCMIGMIVAEDDGAASPEIYGAAIQAEFAQLSGRTGTVRDISLLKGLFGKLKTYLNKQVTEK